MEFDFDLNEGYGSHRYGRCLQIKMHQSAWSSHVFCLGLRQLNSATQPKPNSSNADG